MTENLRTLILAAGKGTRMKSKKAKVLHKVGGATLIEHVVAAARGVSSDVTVVVGHQAEIVKSMLAETAFVDQKEQLGTGHAVIAARDAYRGFSGDILVLAGDVPGKIAGSQVDEPEDRVHAGHEEIRATALAGEGIQRQSRRPC